MTRLFTFVFLFSFTGSFATSTFFTFQNSTIQLADSAAAAIFISTSDGHAESFSTFDMHGRFQDNNNHTAAEYYQFATTQMRSWDTNEEQKIRQSFTSIAKYCADNKINLKLPDTILFIKSTCKEEFGAGGYTRRNGIIINETEHLTTGLTAHELFHVLSRNDTKLRDKIYATIGFKPCNKISVTEAMQGLNITNPDCPTIAHYVTINDEDLVLVLHSKRDYDGGHVFENDYIDISLLKLAGTTNKTPLIKDGEAVTYKLEEKFELFGIIGTNTMYVLHPEEVCAENFAALVTEKNVREPKYLELMKKLLSDN